jgi:hypothetical protein
MKTYMVTQNNSSEFFEVFEDAVQSMKFEDAELWLEVEDNSYIKLFLP